MDPNAVILDILDKLQYIAISGHDTQNITDRDVHDALVETIVDMHNLGKWLERGGNRPTLALNIEKR